MKYEFNITYNHISKRGNVLSDNMIDRTYEVEFLNCLVDKADDFKIIDADSHFVEFSGVHISKIHQGKLFLQDILKPEYRQKFFDKICKKDARYIYMDVDILNSENEPVFVHCTAENSENSSLCRIVFADVSKSREKTRELKEQAKEINQLIDLVTGGVCLFKVTPEMHFEAIYMNQGACRIFGTSKENYSSRVYRIDDLIHKDDKTVVFQAVGRAMATGENIDLEYRVLTHRDQPIWCKCNAAVQRYDEDGCPIFHAMFTDISGVKAAEERADRANEKLVNLLKNLSGAIFFSTVEKPFECDLISGDFVKLTGYSRSEFFDRFGGDFSRLLGENADSVADEIRKTVLKGGSCSVSYQLNARGAKVVNVTDVRKLITQSDGSQVLIGELTAVNNE